MSTPSASPTRTPARVPGGRLAYERGIRYSSLPAPARHLALTLATWADIDAGVIPDWCQPSQSTLEEATGLSRGAVFKHLNTLEEQGWIGREIGGGRNKRSRYWLVIPPGAKTGHQVTGNAPENQSRGDWYPGNQSRGEPETSHVVNENQSPRDYKSPSKSPFNSPSSSAEQIVQEAAVVTPEEEEDFIAWIRITHQPKKPGWWRAVARNGDFASLAADWRASLPKPRASPADRGELCGCCGATAPAACHYRGRAYCASCTAKCDTCSTPTPADQMPEGVCHACHTNRSTAA